MSALSGPGKMIQLRRKILTCDIEVKSVSHGPRATSVLLYFLVASGRDWKSRGVPVSVLPYMQYTRSSPLYYCALMKQASLPFARRGCGVPFSGDRRPHVTTCTLRRVCSTLHTITGERKTRRRQQQRVADSSQEQGSGVRKLSVVTRTEFAVVLLRFQAELGVLGLRSVVRHCCKSWRWKRISLQHMLSSLRLQ